MARYYFDRYRRNFIDEDGLMRREDGWAVRDSHQGGERIGTLHDVVLAERVVDLLNQYEEKFDGR